MGKGEIARYRQFLLFPECFQNACFSGASKGVIVWEWVKANLLHSWQDLKTDFQTFTLSTVTLKFLLIYQLFPKRQNLDSSKLKEFTHDNSKYVENGRKFFKQVENTVGKGEIGRYEQFLLFQQRFQKTSIEDR